MKGGNALLMLMVGVAQALFQPEAICDMSQETTCYGTLGQTMFLQLSKNTTGMDVTLYHNNVKIFYFRFKSRKQSFYKSGLKERCQFNPNNGTLSISPVLRDDSGLYKVDIHDGHLGKSKGSHEAKLTIEAPVDTPVLTHLCDDQNRTVNCSSSGDSIQYSWSLDGKTLGDIRRPTDHQTLQLMGNVTGKLTCTVKNNVSSGNKTVLLKPCHDPQTVTVPDRSDRTETLTTRPPSSISAVIIEGGMHWIYYVIIAVSAMLLISLTVTIHLCRKRNTTQTEEQGWSAEMDHRADDTENNY